MFTFGREKEKQSALYYLSAKDPEKQRVLDLVDSIHDFLEGNGSEESVRTALRASFTRTASGGWEQTGTWLRKPIKHYPSFESMWLEMADDKDSKVRFRVACNIDDMPPHISDQVYAKLKDDKSKKVSDMAKVRRQG